MAKLNIRELKSQAAQRLENQSNPKHIILVYTLVLAALSLVISGLSLYLDSQIGSTGGLSGIGMRSVLQTLQTLLSYFATLFTPFWTAGLLSAAIAIAREQEAGPRHLMDGFKRAPRVLSYSLLEILISMLVCMSCFYMATYLYMLTPLSDGLSNAVSGMTEAQLTDTTAILAALPYETLMQTAIGIVACFLVFFIPIFGYISYSMRMGLYLVMQGKRTSAFAAVLMSNQLMKGHRLQLFRLDLSHWWYFLLESLIAVVAYLDVILPMFGVELPFGETTAYFAAMIASLIVQLVLYVWKKLQVETTYVLAFENFAQPIRDVKPAE